MCADGNVGPLYLLDVDTSRLSRSERGRECEEEVDDQEILDGIQYILSKRAGFPSEGITIEPEDVSPPPPPPSTSSRPRDDSDKPNELDSATDDEIWNPKNRSAAKRLKDLECTTKLVEAVKQHWEYIQDKKLSRELVWGKVAATVRSLGVKISRAPIIWKKIYDKWRKMKSKYKDFIDNSNETGTGSMDQPPLFEEMHEFLSKF